MQSYVTVLKYKKQVYLNFDRNRCIETKYRNPNRK